MTARLFRHSDWIVFKAIWPGNMTIFYLCGWGARHHILPCEVTLEDILLLVHWALFRGHFIRVRLLTQGNILHSVPWKDKLAPLYCILSPEKHLVVHVLTFYVLERHPGSFSSDHLSISSRFCSTHLRWRMMAWQWWPRPLGTCADRRWTSPDGAMPATA